MRKKINREEKGRRGGMERGGWEGRKGVEGQGGRSGNISFRVFISMEWRNQGYVFNAFQRNSGTKDIPLMVSLWFKGVVEICP